VSRSTILSKYGITDHNHLRVRLVQEGDTLWRVGINGPGNPVTALAYKQAVALAIELRQADEDQLASDIIKAADQVMGANAKGA
jgi:hypothetical protein